MSFSLSVLYFKVKHLLFSAGLIADWIKNRDMRILTDTRGIRCHLNKPEQCPGSGVQVIRSQVSLSDEHVQHGQVSGRVFSAMSQNSLSQMVGLLISYLADSILCNRSELCGSNEKLLG